MNRAAKALARLVNDEESILFDALTRCGSESTLLAHRIRSLVNAAEFGDDDPEAVEVEIEIVQALIDGRARPFCDAIRVGAYVEWHDDWEIGSHLAEFGEAYENGEPTTCEVAMCYAEDGTLLGSLGCVDDASEHDRRVVEAGLFMEYLPAPGDMYEI